MSIEFQRDVLPSHGSKARAVVRLRAARLRQDELRVWFDEWELKPADSIRAKIMEKLEHSARARALHVSN